LENIIANKDYILKNGLFVSLVGEEIAKNISDLKSDKKSLAQRS
jgi:hypothetical protein